MKNILNIIAVVLGLMVTGLSHARSRTDVIVIGNPIIEKDGDLVTVRFRAEIDKTIVRRNHNLFIAPVITDGIYHWSMPVLIVHGKGSRASLERKIRVSRKERLYENSIYARNSGKVEYYAAAPYQEWMEGAGLSVQAVLAGCCSSSTIVSRSLSEDLKLQPGLPEIHVAESAVVPVTVLTSGDSLASRHGYIIPVEKYDSPQRGLLFNDEREGSIKVHYPQGIYTIDGTFADNERSLAELTGSIGLLANSPDCEVAVVVIAGFASPEGSFDLNDRLAWNRAQSVKTYVLEHSGLDPDQIEVYNGSEDWQGLRMLVEASDMDGKEAVLRIIDNVPVWDPKRNAGRLGELMRLDNGEPYRYMYEHFFPALRNSAYIRVYYRNLE